jgi:hypothetical protein
MFPPNCHFTLVLSKKNQQFYEFILIDTDFVLLFHTPYKFDNTNKRIAFSKCIIKQVLSPAQWGYSPWKMRNFSISFNPPFNYFDYQQA